MFIVPSRQIDDNYGMTYRCISSIRKTFKNEKICLVDSNSTNKTYIDNLDVDYVLFENENYELGALHKTFDKFPDENRYRLIHDSVWINKQFDESQDLVTVQWFNGFWDSVEQQEWVINNLPSGIKFKHSFIGVFGSMFSINGKYIRNLYSLGLETIRPTNKLESCACERAIGICFDSLSLNSKNSLQGMHISSETEYDTTWVKKHFRKRQ